MKKSRGILLLLAAVVILGGCKKNGSGKPDLQPAVTPVGTIDGTAKMQTIGSAGGTIVSDDGEMELIIPSGALAANTDITIQPITNKAPNGRRKAYRCLPDGLTFSKDITIRFHYTEADAAATEPEYMMVAFQTDAGNWQVIDNVNNDIAGKTISVAINHFTDFSAFDIMRIEPAALYLRTNETGEYKITATGMSDLNAVYLLTALLERPETWKVNGIAGGNSNYGTISLSSDQTKGVYRAPATAPDPNPVDISAEINLPFTVDGQQFNTGILTAKAYIIGGRYRLELEFTGEGSPGSGEMFRVQDNVRMTCNLIGAEGTITDCINVIPTFTKIQNSPNNCTATFLSNGTGPINLRDIDAIGVTKNTLTGDVYVYFAADVGAVPARVQINCPQATPQEKDWLPWNSGGAVLTFKDNGQSQVIEMSQISSQMIKLIATPIQ